MGAGPCLWYASGQAKLAGGVAGSPWVCVRSSGDSGRIRNGDGVCWDIPEGPGSWRCHSRVRCEGGLAFSRAPQHVLCFLFYSHCFWAEGAGRSPGPPDMVPVCRAGLCHAVLADQPVLQCHRGMGAVVPPQLLPAPAALEFLPTRPQQNR